MSVEAVPLAFRNFYPLLGTLFSSYILFYELFCELHGAFYELFCELHFLS